MSLHIHLPYSLHDYLVTSDTTAHIDALRALYHCAGQTSSKPYRRISIVRDGDSFHVSYGRRSVISDTPIQLVQNILFEEQEYTSDVLPLHAGAVAAGGKAWIFLAPTGAGKTTLITYLTARGFAYINDDRVFIKTDFLRCAAHITPIHLRPKSIPILEYHGCSIRGELMEIEHVRRFVHMPEAVVSDDLPLGGLFFLVRSKRENTCLTLAGGEAVQRLMQNLLTIKRGSEQLHCAVRLVRFCRELHFSEFSYVYELINKEAGYYNT